MTGPFRAVLSAGLLIAASACSPPPRTSLQAPAAAGRIEWARSAYEKNREKAFAPRRFKALFKGDISPEVGAILHGYLLVWWDGETLAWKTSAPLAGTVGKGVLRPHADEGGAHVPFPGGLTERDAVGVLLGALDLSSVARPVEIAEGGARIRLDDAGRVAQLDEAGRIVRLELGPDTNVELAPGDGVPRRIAAKGKDGRAQLSLESFGPWPLEEPIP
ncbi:MAG: hypothetical protein ABIT01_17935 [Thermoanaerobaculia bacterium]